MMHLATATALLPLLDAAREVEVLSVSVSRGRMDSRLGSSTLDLDCVTVDVHAYDQHSAEALVGVLNLTQVEQITVTGLYGDQLCTKWAGWLPTPVASVPVCVQVVTFTPAEALAGVV